MNQTAVNPKDNKALTVIKWIVSVLLILSVIGALAMKAFISALIYLLVGLLLLPPLTNFWREKFPFLRNRVIKGVALFALLVVGALVSPKTDNLKPANAANAAIASTNETTSAKTEDIEPVASIPYEIVHEASIRFDKAPSYFVLIDKVDVSNDKFIGDIKTLINKIVTEKGAKISINILDDKKALDLMYKSHYGVNNLGRILNKSELKTLEKHSVASFSGELETDMYKNSLYIFPSADKNTPQVGKYVSIDEYNPVIKDDRVVKKQREEIKNLKDAENKKIEDFKKNCFSAWDGSHRQLEKYIKSNMNDPKSYDHVETTFSLQKDYAIVLTKFRGKNAFGGTVLNSVKAKVSYDCNVIEIIE